MGVRADIAGHQKLVASVENILFRESFHHVARRLHLSDALALDTQGVVF